MSAIIVGVRTVAVPVTDQDRALAFYTETLGLGVRLDVPLPGGGRWIEVAPAGAATSVALMPAGGGAPALGQTGIRFTTIDAAASRAALAARGVDVGELLQWPGVPAMFEVRDQDGNAFQLVELVEEG